MKLIPAIDLIDNQCVRLSQGDYNLKVVYDNDPVLRARQFEKEGFTDLHLVDLEGARQKSPAHFHLLKAISRNTRLKVDFSGGIRSLNQARQAFENGASAVTIGSLAVEDPEIVLALLREYGPRKIILGADVKNGAIATGGWLQQTESMLFPFLEYWTGQGIEKIMITDISQDGMMQGPATELYQQVLAQFPSVSLIASGGVAAIGNLYQLKALGCYGAIIGKALYENVITPQQINEFLSYE